jgi:glucose-6-phosphate dehydrogenase assembly protein OpcA
MRGQIIDGEGWIAERLRFLRERLAGELSDEERRATEAEVESLSEEGGIMPLGLRFPRMLRRLRRKR